MLNFPFWIITQRRELMSLPVEPDGLPGYVAAFSTAQIATTFMVDRGETNWEFRMMSRSTLPALIGELRKTGAQGFCVDPGEEGCGTKLTFDELEKATR